MPIDRDLGEAKEVLEQAKQLILEGKGVGLPPGA